MLVVSELFNFLSTYTESNDPSYLMMVLNSLYYFQATV